MIGYVRELEGTKLVVLCNLCEEELPVIANGTIYSDGKVDGTLRPYECKMMRSI